MPALQVQPGVPLNRLRASVVVPNYPALNATAANMGSEFVAVGWQDDFALLIPTATGAVESDNPFVMGTITVSLLKTQPLSAAWVTQAQSESGVGNVTVYPDASSFPAFTFNSCVIQRIEPSAYNGRDPVVRVSLHGVFYVNSALWSEA